MKTAELTGIALDWAVAKCEGATDFETDGITCGFKLNGVLKVLATGWASSMCWNPSTDWAQGGPIIERCEIELNMAGIRTWRAKTISLGRLYDATGQTPLVAAMRCYVASKLGDDVETPKELIE